MGESCRHQSPASVSLTLPEEPPDSQASLQEPATALPPLPNGKIKGCPHSLYRGRAQGAEAQRRAARARFFRAAGTQGEPGLRGGLQPSPAPRHEGGAAGSEPRAPHRRWEPPQPPLPPVQPRAGPRTGDPAPRPPRAARAASWAAGAGEPGMGAGAARPSPPPPPPPPLQTRAPPHAPLGPGRWRTVPLPGPGADKKKKKKDKIRTDSCSPWNRGGLAPYPFFMLRRRPPGPAPRWGSTESPSGAPGCCGVEAAPGSGWGAGPPGMPPGAPTARPSRRGARDARANNAASRRGPAPPPLPARRSTTGRGDPRLQRGEPRGALRLASQPLPGAAAGGPRGSELQMDTFPPWSPARRGAARRADAAAAHVLVRGQEDGASPCPGAPWYCPIRTLGEGAGENGAGLGNEGRWDPIEWTILSGAGSKADPPLFIPAPPPLPKLHFPWCIRARPAALHAGSGGPRGFKGSSELGPLISEVLKVISSCNFLVLF